MFDIVTHWFFCVGALAWAICQWMLPQTRTEGHNLPQGQSYIKPSNLWKLLSPSSSPMPSPILADYLQRREKLIAEDRALRIDRVRANYTATELKADEVVRSIRAREAVTVWGINHEHVPHPFPGMEFLNGMILGSCLILPLTSTYSQRHHFTHGSLQ